jgi:hypothetical protein
MENTMLSILWCLTVMIMLTVNSILIFIIYMKINYLQGSLEGVCSSLGVQAPARPRKLRDIFREPRSKEQPAKTAEETA